MILAVLAVALLPAAISARDGEKVAELVTRFASVVNAGGDLEQFAFEPRPSEQEIEAVSLLAGCVPTVAERSHSGWVALDWACPSNPQNERQTAINFERNGKKGLWVNPIESKLRPSPLALCSEDLPSHHKIASQFAKAVRLGEDFSLGGLIPLTPEQSFRLASIAGQTYAFTSGNSRTSQAMFWTEGSKSGTPSMTTDLRFDDEGCPIGLILSSVSIIY